MAVGEGTLVAVEGGPEAKINGGAHTTQLKKIDQVHTQHLIDELLDSYKDLFAEPTTLPPTRTLDHSINQKPNAEPINIRSYRYSPT